MTSPCRNLRVTHSSPLHITLMTIAPFIFVPRYTALTKPALPMEDKEGSDADKRMAEMMGSSLSSSPSSLSSTASPPPSPSPTSPQSPSRIKSRIYHHARKLNTSTRFYRVPLVKFWIHSVIYCFCLFLMFMSCVLGPAGRSASSPAKLCEADRGSQFEAGNDVMNRDLSHPHHQHHHGEERAMYASVGHLVNVIWNEKHLGETVFQDMLWGFSAVDFLVMLWMLGKLTEEMKQFSEDEMLYFHDIWNQVYSRPCHAHIPFLLLPPLRLRGVATSSTDLSSPLANILVIHFSLRFYISSSYVSHSLSP